MIQGLYAAASGLVALENRQAISANNIANGSMVGFRRQHSIQKGFYSMLAGKMSGPRQFEANSAPGGGVAIDETFTDVAAGVISQSDNPLHVALSGPGFLAVNTPRGERYTRSGDLKVDAEGQLAGVDGLKIQGNGGPIDVQGPKPEIASDGTVMVDGAVRDKLRVVEFEDPHMLTREGNGLYQASAEALQRSAAAEKTRVIPKSLEASNVNMPKEMIQLILGLRAYGANQKVINAFDESTDRVIQQIGMPA